MQRNENDDLKKTVAYVKSTGDYIGNQCISRFTLLAAGENIFYNLAMLGIKGPLCYAKGKGIEKIPEKYPQLESELGALFVSAGTAGMCRFFQKNKIELPSECDNAKKSVREAKAACFAAYDASMKKK